MTAVHDCNFYRLSRAGMIILFFLLTKTATMKFYGEFLQRAHNHLQSAEKEKMCTAFRVCVCVCKRGGVRNWEGIDCRRSSSRGVGWIVIATDV